MEKEIIDLTARIEKMDGVVKGLKEEVKAYRPVILMYARRNLLWVIAMSLAIVSIIMQIVKQ